MLVVVELAATLGDRQHQEERKAGLLDLAKKIHNKAPLGVLFLWAFHYASRNQI